MPKLEAKGESEENNKGRQITKNTLPALKQNANLWYKIRVLVYDLRNIKSDPSSESRTLLTTDELYISGPYFSSSEADLIKGTIIHDVWSVKNPVETAGDAVKTAVANEGIPILVATATATTTDVPAPGEAKTVEEVIKERLAGFFDKRKASGDSRPCGPHDMAPIYESVFEIRRGDLQDKKFLGRLRRSGLAGASEPGKKEEKKPKKDGKAHLR